MAQLVCCLTHILRGPGSIPSHGSLSFAIISMCYYMINNNNNNNNDRFMSRKSNSQEGKQHAGDDAQHIYLQLHVSSIHIDVIRPKKRN